MSLGYLKLRELSKSLESKKSIPNKVSSFNQSHWLVWRTQFQQRNADIEKIRCKKNVARIILNECELYLFTELLGRRTFKFLKEFTCVARLVDRTNLVRLDKIMKSHFYLRKIHIDIRMDYTYPLETCLKSRKFKNLSSLDIRFYRLTNSLIYKFFRSLSALNKLKKFELHMNLDKETMDKGMRDFPRQILGLKNNIESLVFQISSNATLNINLNHLFKGISLLTSLKRFKLQFQCPIISNVNDIQISNFLTNVKLDELDSFIIYLPKSNRITDQTLFRFGDSFHSLKKIKALQLKFSSDEITDAGVWKLNSLVNLEHLINLQLGFVGCENISNASVRSLFRSIGKLFHLKTLSFNFMCSKISEKSLKDLCFCFGGSQIETFNLCLRSCNEIEHHLTFISSITGQIFKSFSLDVSQNQVILKKLCNLIQTLSSLEELSLSLCKSTLADCDFIDLFESFPHITRLKRLNLSFDENSISNLTIYSLVQALTPFKNLFEFQLSLKNCSKLTNEAFIELGLMLRKVSSLLSLKMNFNSCILIEPDTIQRYGEFLSTLKMLEKLDLSFDGCSKITTQSVFRLANAIANLKKLKQVDIKAAKTKSSYVRIENLENFLKSS